MSEFAVMSGAKEEGKTMGNCIKLWATANLKSITIMLDYTLSMIKWNLYILIRPRIVILIGIRYYWQQVIIIRQRTY